VKRLEREGLITRHTDQGDNRIVLAAITPKGREVLVPATRAANEVFESIGLEEADVDELITLINPIRDAAGDHVDRRSADETED
jgi:DNA-binding MarR family transcriptional regulator